MELRWYGDLHKVKRLIKEGVLPESLALKGFEELKDLKSLLPSLEVFSPEDLLRSFKLDRISTGCRALDDVLGGGIETQAVTEFVGEFGAGKTQLCHQLAVMVQLPVDKGGLSGKAVYIDTEGTFRPERIIQIAQYRGIEPREALKNIIYARIYDPATLLASIKEIDRRIKEVKLIIIDNLASPFRGTYYEVSKDKGILLYSRELASLLFELNIMSFRANLATVITNQLIAVPEAGEEPYGSIYLSSFITHRIMLRKLRSNKRIAKVIFSKSSYSGEGVFSITDRGIA